MPRVVQVTAPSRLHFGMFSFGRRDTRQFGGVGAMIDQPGLRITCCESNRLEAHGPLHERAAEFARRAFTALKLGDQSGCRIDVLAAPPEHVGLGVGTQLGLAIGSGLAALFGRAAPDPVELATVVGRGQRSAVGTYGFASGGLIVEAGKFDSHAISPLVMRMDLPDAWRWVLMRPTDGSQGLSGSVEGCAFAALPPVPTEVTSALCNEVLLHLAPAAREGRFDEFSESLYRFGHLAGTCFSARQGGPYASERLAGMVALVRSLGIAGVGQTSWGPTLFALTLDAERAKTLVEQLRNQCGVNELDLTIAAPDNRGAQIQLSAE